MKIRKLTDDEYEKINFFLEDGIKNDTELKEFDKIKYQHTLAHELGHLKVAKQKGFNFSYIRVYRYMCYIGENSKLKKIHLNGKQYKQICKKNGIRDILKHTPNGQCVVFASNLTATTAKHYIAVLSAGLAATKLFKKKLEQESSEDEINKFYWDCYIFNIEKNPKFFSLELPVYIAKLLTRNSDQNLILRLKLCPKFHEKLNDRFQNVDQYMTIEDAKLPNCYYYYSMRKVCEVIRKIEFS